MPNRSTIFITIGAIAIAAVALFFVVYNHMIPMQTSSMPAQILSTASTTVISSSTAQALFATTTSPLQTATKTIITAKPNPIIAQPVEPSPVTTVITKTTPATTTPTTTTNSDPVQLAIDPQTIVGILCYYNDTYTDENTGQSVYEADDEEVRGSGVIINSQGDILTNRHIIQQPESYTTINDSNGNPVPVSVVYQLDHCEVGQLPKGSTLPTAAQIESTNPYIQIPVLGYTAQPIFISSSNGLSSDEIQYADFAVLGITGVSSSGPTFGITSVPRSFPHATLLPIEYEPDVLNAQVITYGFPGNVTTGQGNFFQTLTMTGSVGTVSSVETGNQFYSGIPLLINTNLEIAHGRSGSPLFWRGYVIGIVTFFVGNNDTNSGSVASDAILKGLQNTNYIPAN